MEWRNLSSYPVWLTMISINLCVISLASDITKDHLYIILWNDIFLYFLPRMIDSDFIRTIYSLEHASTSDIDHNIYLGFNTLDTFE